MNNNNTWVKFYRKTLENIELMNDNNAFMVFAKLLLLVNSKGQYAGGRNKLGEAVNLNPRTLYDVLKRLETLQIINIKSNKRYSIISICNWSKYQAMPNRLPNNDPTMTQQWPNTNTRIKNKNKKAFNKKNDTTELTDEERRKARDNIAKLRLEFLSRKARV